MQRIAIIEPSHSHEEVILPQIELLRGQYDVYVVAPQSLLTIELLKDAASLFHACAFSVVTARNRLLRLMGLPFKYLAIARVVRSIDPHVLIFNSTYTLLDVALICWVFRKYKKAQIIHNFEQFLPPFGRWLYHRFSANLVISEEVHRYVVSTHPEYADLDYVLPIFFDSFVAAHDCVPQRLTKRNGMLKLGVFGTIEDSRRNYSGLLESLHRLAQSRMEVGFRIYLVGKAPPEIQNYIQTHGLDTMVETFSAFVPFHTMFSLLAEMDVVMFLVDRHVKYAGQYNRYKISGTSTLMKAFRKVGCASDEFLVDASLAAACFTYPGDDIGHFLRQIADGHITLDTVRAKASGYAADDVFSFTKQQTRLVSLIRRILPVNG
jgi:hypothetical protein